jgi:hypothetical protein
MMMTSYIEQAGKCGQVMPDSADVERVATRQHWFRRRYELLGDVRPGRGGHEHVALDPSSVEMVMTPAAS